MSTSAVDVEDIPIARVYADAVWAIASKTGQQEVLADELDTYAELVTKIPRFKAFNNIGTITQDQRQHIIETVFKGRVSDTLYRLLCNLNEHNRKGLLPAIAQHVRERVVISKGRIRITV